MDRMEKHLRAHELQDKIMECVEEIIRCEDELVSLGIDDMFSRVEDDTDFFWRNFRWIQNGRTTLAGNLGRYSEISCHAVAALLEQTMLPKPQQGLLMRGCSTLLQGNHVRFCISGEVDESIYEQIRVCPQLETRRNRKE